MSGAFSRIGRTFLRYLVKTAFLLLAVSIIAFALVSASPVDPVQQYVLGVGGVSPEQRLSWRHTGGSTIPRWSAISLGWGPCSGGTSGSPSSTAAR